MAKKVNVLIKQGSIEKRIFKLFVDKKGDLFISFHYFNSQEFYCGTGYFPPGVSELKNLNPVLEGTKCRIPVKFSYHQDGKIHFKPVNAASISLPPRYKTAEIRGTPFKSLKAQHIFTIEVEGLERFDDFKLTKKSALYMGFIVPIDAKRFKFVGYAGLSDDDLKGRFRSCKIIKIERPNAPNPLVIGLYFRPFPESLAKENSRPSVLCLTGFSLQHTNTAQEASFLYLMAK